MNNETPSAMTQETTKLPHDMNELIKVIAELPAEQRNRIEPIVTRVAESTHRRKRILSLVQEALGQLRLDMKYLMFDLEATRRERNSYQAELEGLGDL